MSKNKDLETPKEKKAKEAMAGTGIKIKKALTSKTAKNIAIFGLGFASGVGSTIAASKMGMTF